MIRNKWMGLFLVAATAQMVTGAELHVYSHRHYATDEKVNKLFTAKTGIEVKVVNAQVDQLVERLRSEGESSPADVLIAVDAGRMQRAAAEGLLQPVETEILKEKTPEALRSSEGYWYPFTLRARVIVVAKDRVKSGELKTYEDLAKPEWRGRVLSRSSTSGYSQALLSSIVAAKGEETATKWAAGMVNNMARPPQGGDRDQIKAVAAGLADAAITNSYYLGLLLNSSDGAERAAGKKVRIVFPNSDGLGTHTNVSGIGVVKHSKNVEAAKKYMEFLLSDEVQKLYANETFEHPVSMDLSLGKQLEEWGEFKVDEKSFPKLGDSAPAAIRIFDKVGWK
ncbi:MAG: extracellular solute-binding protein [Akkermansiaceae bacterium]